MASKAGAGVKKARTTTTKTPTNGASKRPTSVATPAAVTADVSEQIRRRAYELYEQRGRQHGFHEQDWLQAESELTSRSA